MLFLYAKLDVYGKAIDREPIMRVFREGFAIEELLFLLLRSLIRNSNKVLFAFLFDSLISCLR